MSSSDTPLPPAAGCPCDCCDHDAPAVAALRKLRWCCRHWTDDATLSMVTPAAVCMWLSAHGWEPDTEPSILDARWHKFAKRWPGEDFVGRANLPVAFSKLSQVRRVLESIESYEDLAAAELVAELLPERGPWDAEVPRG